MEGRRALLIFLLFPHVARRGCLASMKDQLQPVGGGGGDQVSDGSSWIPYIWDTDREGRHYGPALPLARPRQRHDIDEPELLFAIWESPPVLAKEGLTEEEVDWVPDVKPLQTIKENYVSGSREFDHHFSYETHPKVRHSAPHTLAPSTTLPPPPPPPPPHEPPTSHTEAPTPDTPAHEPHTDSPITYTDTPAPHAPPHPHPFPSLHRQPFKVVLPLRQRPRKYFLAGGEDTHTHEDAPSHSGPFRKYYLDPDSKATQDIDSLSSHEKPLHPHFFPVLPPAYPQPLHPRPPPTVRQYFLQPAADEEPHAADLTAFEVYEKLRKTRTVDTQVDTEARAWVLSGIPKATSWVSSSTGRRLS